VAGENQGNWCRTYFETQWRREETIDSSRKGKRAQTQWTQDQVAAQTGKTNLRRTQVG